MQSVPSNEAPILVVQGDVLTGMALEMDLEAGGLGQAVIFQSGDQARAWLEGMSPSAAVLDWRPGDASCMPVARLLRERGIPFVVHSVASGTGGPAGMGEAAWFEMPTPTRRMAEAIAGLVPGLAA